MKKILLFTLLLLAQLASMGQQLIKAEYFFDTDPGVGQGTNIAIAVPADSVDFSFSVPVISLSTGLHNLYVRTLNDSGVWSIAENRLINVYKASLAADIVAAEYFLDSDPGIGLGTSIATGLAADSVEFISSIAIGSISLGLHNLYIRTKNNDGIWSISENRLINVYKTGNNTIVWSEYFFNTDPGVGNGIGSAVPAPANSVEYTTTASVLSLLSGNNIIYERTKNADGIWSISEGRSFNICPVLTDASFSVVNSCVDSITQFINTSTGYDGSTVFSWDFGDGTPISNSFNESQSIYCLRTSYCYFYCQ